MIGLVFLATDVKSRSDSSSSVDIFRPLQRQDPVHGRHEQVVAQWCRMSNDEVDVNVSKVGESDTLGGTDPSWLQSATFIPRSFNLINDQ